MEEQPFNIPIDEPKKEFEKHLAPDYNKRIIFSAPFGTGKTYFLKKFFDERETEWKVIRLFPVNYSVSSNEDVFELIKFDILFQLMEDGDLKLEDNTFSDFFTSQFFLFNNAEKFVEWLLNKVGSVGQNIVKLADTIELLVSEYEKFKERMNTDPSKDVAFNFLTHLKNKRGTAYEEDAITQLIQIFLQQICPDIRQSVLIIDDLDRIDPEHIFRLLNVFAAHFDIGAPDTNKFGFNKVIFVCDINNIRNIFHAKYGTDTDFTGYIDKFYSTDIFTFDNIDETIKFISQKLFGHFENKSLTQDRNVSYFKLDKNFKALFEYVLKRLVVSKAINYRALQKISNFTLDFKEIMIGLNDETNYNSIVVLILNILKKLFGDYESVLTALNKTKNAELLPKYFSYRSENIDISSFLIGNIVAVLKCMEAIVDDKDGVTIELKDINPKLKISGIFLRTPVFLRDRTTDIINIINWKCEPEIDKNELVKKDMELYIYLLNELTKKSILKD